MDETEFGKRAADALRKLDDALRDLDGVECDLAGDILTLEFEDGAGQVGWGSPKPGCGQFRMDIPLSWNRMVLPRMRSRGRPLPTHGERLFVSAVLHAQWIKHQLPHDPGE